LFVADQRDKILKDHPTLDLHKITTLAAIKWRKLSKDQQALYEKKLEEINKISNEELLRIKNRQNSNGDSYLVKKEYCQNEENEIPQSQEEVYRQTDSEQ
jgi:hypothetical protein